MCRGQQDGCACSSPGSDVMPCSRSSCTVVTQIVSSHRASPLQSMIFKYAKKRWLHTYFTLNIAFFSSSKSFDSDRL